MTAGRRKVMIVGPFQTGIAPTHGASVKNRHLADRLMALGYDVIRADTERWRRHPLTVGNILAAALRLRRPDALVVSASRISAYRFISLLRKLHFRAALHYWVIGGRLDEELESGNFKLATLEFPDSVIVETKGMAKRLSDRGLRNVIVIPNFKPLADVPLPSIHIKDTNEPLKAVFIGRITPDKGCRLIFDALDIIKRKQENVDVNVTFFGEIDPVFRDEFLMRVRHTGNAEYAGFLDLTDAGNYSRLATFDIMLFPTMWESEGHAGVLIDALAAGLPTIASRHNDIPEFVINELTGLLIDSGNASELADAITRLHTDRHLLIQMRNHCRTCAKIYDIANILSEQRLKSIF